MRLMSPLPAFSCARTWELNGPGSAPMNSTVPLKSARTFVRIASCSVVGTNWLEIMTTLLAPGLPPPAPQALTASTVAASTAGRRQRRIPLLCITVAASSS